MKNRRMAFIIRGFIPLVFLSGCSFLSTATGTQPATPSVEISSNTPTRTVRPTITITSTQTETQTRIPTMLPEVANGLMKELLMNNSGCDLPCVWGISTGKTTFVEGSSLLYPLSSISDFTFLEDSPGAMDPVLTINDFFINASIRYLGNPNTGIIDRLHVDIGPYQRFSDPTFKNGYGYYPLYDLPEFGKTAAFYMLSGILSRNGLPDSVYIMTMGKSGVEGMQYADFDLILLYPDQGMLVNYNTKKRVAGSNVLGCLANALVEFELFPPGNGADFMDNLKGTDWETFRDGYKPLEELTSMTIESFYNTYSKPTDQCLSIPIDKLPVWYP